MTTKAKHELYAILDKLGANLDITDTQYKLAEKRYASIGKWLSEGEYCLVDKKLCLMNGQIYPQGSLKLQTAVKPLGQDEFDVDLVFFTPNVSTSDIEPTELNRLIGNRLREHTTYKDMLEPLKRGWRITYANEFHLDITPSINNHAEAHSNSELVPDRKVQDWKPSNPKDYASWFNEIVEKVPSFKSSFGLGNILATEARTVVELPENNFDKPLLKRYIQILKRHRDVMFQDKENKPISIIITTLAAKAYLYCIEHNQYDNEFDLLSDVVKYMPCFIHLNEEQHEILNPKALSENFAERWNEVANKKLAFDNWQNNAQIFFESFNDIVGQNMIFESLENGFGKVPVSRVYEDVTNSVSSNRANGLLGLGSLTGLTDSYSMKKNTFFGN
ncbi:MAG: nucleotidyltransferase [Sulfurimonas sp.]